MSWDVYAMAFPEGVEPAEIPDDYRGAPLMSRQALIDGIRSVVPNVDFSDPTWGYIRGPTYSIEVNPGDKDPLVSVAFHVRGTGDEAVAVVATILNHFNLRAIDDSMEFFDGERSIASFHEWQQLRNDVAHRLRSEGIS